MGSLLLSGLYSRADAVYACVLGGTAEAIAAASQLLQAFGAKVSILQTSQDMQQMERLTLSAMAGTVRSRDRVLYMHSKGISYEEDSELGLNAYWWTLFMEHFLLQGHARYRITLAENANSSRAFPTSPCFDLLDTLRSRAVLCILEQTGHDDVAPAHQ